MVETLVVVSGRTAESCYFDPNNSSLLIANHAWSRYCCHFKRSQVHKCAAQCSQMTVSGMVDMSSRS